MSSVTMGVHLTGAHLMDVHLVGVYVMGHTPHKRVLYGRVLIFQISKGFGENFLVPILQTVIDLSRSKLQNTRFHQIVKDRILILESADPLKLMPFRSITNQA
jgi:hypothetical protein